MGLSNALKYGALGLAADLFAWPLTMGSGMTIGALAGLFSPEASELDRAYQPERFRGAGSRVGGFDMFSGLFGNSEGPPREARATKGWSDGAKIGALALGAGLLAAGGPGFGFPLYTFFAGLTPYNLGGLLPLAWSNGYIPSWGWGAGFFY